MHRQSATEEQQGGRVIEEALTLQHGIRPAREVELSQHCGGGSGIRRGHDGAQRDAGGDGQAENSVRDPGHDGSGEDDGADRVHEQRSQEAPGSTRREVIRSIDNGRRNKERQIGRGIYRDRGCSGNERDQHACSGKHRRIGQCQATSDL